MNTDITVEAIDTETIVEARRSLSVWSNLSVAELDQAEWERARPVRLTRYWSGETAPFARQAEARLLWDERALYARFVCGRANLIANAIRHAMETWVVGQGVCRYSSRRTPDGWGVIMI